MERNKKTKVAEIHTFLLYSSMCLSFLKVYTKTGLKPISNNFIEFFERYIFLNSTYSFHL